ncbi:MAG TPA: TfoX/Sxy family protein [Chitinophagaceae bacterium]|jgi:TfoX/Sxy family transcriptional regulator of competence genes|nr:TfoX/Sxy family protein [Chitinophagaceae bacterium]
MAYNEKLTKRIREALAHIPNVEEKKMFRGVTFMVNGKMCISAGDNRIMCRIDPAIHEEVVTRKGCRTVQMKGRDYKGYVYVDEEGIKAKKDFDFWIGIALDYNKIAKASKASNKKRRKKEK